ncbi:uncharacterized protein [Drosophila kikkawai]|uniref:Cytochrome P450 4p2 n=1 Tax=Drosophila kikkawai TaxID=30033 RepID=A0ABM3C7J5_DROKI|nr:uncharacterized protein LOC121502862 [Drosophila kikkawai]
MFFLILVVAGSLLLHWLYRLNKDYYVMAFFAKRLYTKDGRSAESISPVAPGKTIFGNTLDLYGCDNAAVFNHSRNRAKEMKESYVHYAMGKPIYNIIDAEIAENVMNHPNLITKGLVYNFLQPFLRTGLLTSTGKKWHARRKMLTPTFHFNILNQFQEIFKAESQKFVQQFNGKDEATIVLNDVIPRFTLNSICETAMGVNLDEMAEKGDRYRENFSQIEECFIRRISNPFFWGDRLFNLLAAKDYVVPLNVVHSFSSEIIAKRRVLLKDELESQQATHSNEDDVFTSKKRFAMLDTLIYAEKDGLIDHIGICEEVDTLMFEGYDTTSIGLIFGLMNMGLYADKQEECYQEIQEHIADDLSNLDIGQLNKLKYLDYFMKESIRLFPSVPIMGREAVQDTELSNGLVLPKGSQITFHVFDIHRNPKYWDNPNEFRPERFLPENCQKRHTYAYVPFSAGQRNCIGQKYAMQEMKTLLVVILKQFKVLPVTDPKSLVFTSGITLRTQNKIQVKLVRRNVYVIASTVSVRTTIMLFLILIVAGSLLLHWLYRLNKDYYVMSFFAKRLYTKDGRSAESISPVAPGKTIFGNTLDLYGSDHAGIFNHSRIRAREMKESYVEYGMGTPIYNIIDAEIAENIMNHPNLITKGLVYNFLHPFLRTGLLTSTGKKWHARRKMLTPTFHFNILNQFQEIFKTESQKFVQQFKGKDEATIVLNDVIPRFTLNSICETAMGVNLDEMAEKGDRYRENFSQIEECFIRRLSNPFFWGDKLFNLLAAKDYVAPLDVVHGFSSEIIAKRRILLKDELESQQSTHSNEDDVFTTKKRFAMLDTLIYAEKDGLIDHIGICEEVDTLMFEGYDTTSIGLIFGLMNMGLYADKQEECYQEIQEHISDDLSNLDIGQLNKLKYLDYFMKESIRLFPSVPIMGREAVQDTELSNGLVLPKGSQITIHVFDINRNPKYWDNPNEFRPERFLPENCQKRHTYAYVPFSAGQRNCIGQKFAMQEIKTLLVVVLKEFKVLPVTDPKSIVFTTGITLRTQNKIQVKLVRRK